MKQHAQQKSRSTAARNTQRKSAQRKKDHAQAKKLSAKPAYLQKKMDVSSPGDSQEQEADRVAEEVTRKPRGISRQSDQKVQRASATPDGNEGNEQSLQAKPAISRMEENEAAAKINRMEDEVAATKLMRSEEEVQTQLQRSEDETIAAKLHRMEEEGEAQTKLIRAETDDTAQANLYRQPEEKEQAQTVGLSDEAEQKIDRLRGMGEPMQEDVLKDMEENFGADFSAVRIHTDGEADQLAKQINARAFAVGNDIFFAAGEYAPESEQGRKLLAHELTHVVQQGGSVERKIMRTAGQPAPTSNTYTHRIGEIDTGSNPKKMRIKQLRVPTFKNRFYRASQPSQTIDGLLSWRRNEATGGEARETNQISVWESDVRQEADSKVESKLRRAHRTEVGGKYIYYFKYNQGKSYLFGTEQTIKERCRRPLWRRDGTPANFQVDHQIEHQTGGPDSIDNMWLLDGPINGQSGREIRSEIRSKVGAFVDHVQDKVVDPPQSIDDARTNYVVYFDPISSGLGSYGAVRAKQQYFTRDHIKNGDHLAPLDPMSETEIDRSGLLDGDAENISIFPTASGGYRYQLIKDSGSNTYHLSTQSIRGMRTQNFDITSVEFDTESKQGSINIRVPSESLANRLPAPVPATNLDPVSISPMDGIEWGGRFDKDSLKRQVTTALDDFPGLSPLAINGVDITPSGIAITGAITPSIPLLENAGVNFSLEGQELRVWKEFSGPDLYVPAPFQLNRTTLALGISNSGLFINGRVDFGIDNVGEGHIGASAEAAFDNANSFAVSGEFTFDERLFGEGTTAQVRVGYENQQWSMGGAITIPEGKVPGISSATINVDYSEGDGFSASGEAELSVPGVESGTLSITQSEEEGFSIGGTFNLSADTPGIRGGTISATLTEKEDGSGYALSASGEAQPDIPGINSNFAVTYNDGAFTAEVTAQYARGMLSGQINAGVTNRGVGEDGQLTDTAEPDNPLIVYGGGSLTIQIAPWLQGTAGVQFAPDGEITVIGEIGLPDELEIFARREINKSIFNIAVQAPIVPGIVAEVGGGLSATAGIGPGVIDELRLGITYNPAHEEDTEITGDAHLSIPADAGLRLSVRAGIGLGITGASATGGLDIGGTLGIEGEAEAGVHIEWTPATGLDLSANVAVHAQPSFTFDIGGYVSVRALGFSVYDERFEFASYTFGSDYRFGIRLPINYHEGEPFDISLDDVEFEVPDIDTDQLLSGLISRIT